MNRREFISLVLPATTGSLIGIPSVGAATPSPRIGLGIDTLAAHGFSLLRNKRVGLLTHPAGVNRNGISTIDVLRRAPGVRLTALFGPEHGIYGDEKANEKIPNRTDTRTGLPVFSLYGDTRRPTDAMLRHIDVMVIDLQDLGVRSYTYASSMRYTMETCFEAGKEVVVLDRPNPLGGLKADGPPLEEKWMSYVGAFRVPYVHGLTIGELARMAKETPGWLKTDPATQKNGELSIVPMSGWKRHMMWTDTGLRWIPTSPAIPDLSAAMGYSMTGLGTQLGQFRHGFGTRYPFRLLQHTGFSPEQIRDTLTRRNIPGLSLKVVHFEGRRNEINRGAYVMVRNWNQLRPTEISFHMMQLTCEWTRSNPFSAATSGKANLFNKHVGSTPWWQAITREGARVNVDAFVTRWASEASSFHRNSQRFWIYT